MVRDLDDRKRASGTAHDDPLLSVLRRLGRFGRLRGRLRVERTERGGGTLQQLVGAGVSGDDDVRVVRRVVPAVMRVETLARHELDLVLAPDDPLPVRMPRERDRLQLLAEQERSVVLESLPLAHDDVALGFGLLERDRGVAK